MWNWPNHPKFVTHVYILNYALYNKMQTPMTALTRMAQLVFRVSI